MIKTFRCKHTEQLWLTGKNRRFSQIAKLALRKLQILNAAENLDTLAIVPGNRFEKLKGDRHGQCSIRINDQWRLCFGFRAGEAFAVEITDYH